MTIRLQFRLVAIAWLLSAPTVVLGQWEVWDDPGVASLCGAINTTSEPLTVRSCDAALVLLEEPNRPFCNTFVDANGIVFVDDAEAGQILYSEDQEGFFTLWWLSAEGQVISLDQTTASSSSNVPADFSDSACSVGELWDNAADCEAQDACVNLDATALIAETMDNITPDDSNAGDDDSAVNSAPCGTGIVMAMLACMSVLIGRARVCDGAVG